MKSVKYDYNFSGFRWAIDRRHDLEFVRRVFNYLGPERSFGMTERRSLLREHPAELKETNAGIHRNEGYHNLFRNGAFLH